MRGAFPSLRRAIFPGTVVKVQSLALRLKHLKPQVQMKADDSKFAL